LTNKNEDRARIRAVETNVADDFSGVYRHLIDRFGNRYSSPQAAGGAIGGGGGVFRGLNKREVVGLLRGLGWQETVVGG
jgi:hypothetical protein